MFVKLKNLKIHYKVSGQGDPIVLLHGWGNNMDCFAKLKEYLSPKFTVYVIDLPGFGLSMMPESVWGSAEYAELVKLFLAELQIVNPILLGHSFGGKIVVNLVAGGLIVKKIILIGSAGVLLPRPFAIKYNIYFFKMLNFLTRLPVVKDILLPRLELYKKHCGSKDYQNARGIMRAILIKVVNEDIRGLLARITVSTLLLWGDQDRETPLVTGKIFHKAISNSQLKIITGSGHFPFLDNWEKVKLELDSFLG